MYKAIIESDAIKGQDSWNIKSSCMIIWVDGRGSQVADGKGKKRRTQLERVERPGRG